MATQVNLFEPPLSAHIRGTADSVTVCIKFPSCVIEHHCAAGVWGAIKNTSLGQTYNHQPEYPLWSICANWENDLSAADLTLKQISSAPIESYVNPFRRVIIKMHAGDVNHPLHTAIVLGTATTISRIIDQTSSDITVPGDPQAQALPASAWRTCYTYIAGPQWAATLELKTSN